jgi:hypothetical protein
VPGTGDWQTWVTQTCPLSDPTGVHDVYLVYTGSGGRNLFNVEGFSLRPARGLGADGGVDLLFRSPAGPARDRGDLVAVSGKTAATGVAGPTRKVSRAERALR